MEDRFRFRVFDNRDWSKNKMLHYDAEEAYDYLGGDPTIPTASFYNLLDDDDDWIVEQCTGLKDKNGKLIYEGDILKCTFFNKACSEKEKNAVVVWNNTGAFFTLRADTKDGYDTCVGSSTNCFDSCEVIGNIHENKDILK